MSVRILPRVLTAVGALIVTVAGCSSGKMATGPPTGHGFAYAHPQYLPPPNAPDYFAPHGGRVPGEAFLLDRPGAWMGHDPWAGTAWEGYCFGDIAFSAAPRPCPVGPTQPLPNPTTRRLHVTAASSSRVPSICYPIKRFLKRLGLLRRSRRAGSCRECVSGDVLTPVPLDGKDIPLGPGPLPRETAIPENRIDAEPAPPRIAPLKPVPLDQESLLPVDADPTEELVPDVDVKIDAPPDRETPEAETREDAPGVDPPAPSATQDDAPPTTIVPLNVLPQQVPPPASDAPPKNGPTSRMRLQTHLPVCRLVVKDAKAPEPSVVVRLREIRD